MISLALHALLAAAALLIVFPAYEHEDEDRHDFRLMQVRTGFPNAVPGDVFRGQGTPTQQPKPPQTVQRSAATDGGVTDFDAQPRVVQTDTQVSHIRDDEDAIMPLPAERDSAGARSAAAKPAAPVGDDYLSRLEQRLAQQGEANESAGQAVEGEVLVYDANEQEIARGVRQRSIPSYPAGEQLAGVVKVRIDILPDGGVQNAMIMQKLAPAFDAASLDAAQGWLFDAAPATASHYAVLKFRYVLE